MLWKITDVTDTLARMRSALALIPSAAVVVVAALLAGCGTTMIDSGKAEDSIKKLVLEQAGAKVKAVDCPDGKPAKAGDTFTCTVTGTDATKGDALVTEKDDEGNVRVSAPFVHPRDIESGIASSISKQTNGEAVDVACPEIIVGQTAGTFTCRARQGQNTASVEVTQKDAKGNVRFQVVNSGGG